MQEPKTTGKSPSQIESPRSGIEPSPLNAGPKNQRRVDYLEEQESFIRLCRLTYQSFKNKNTDALTMPLEELAYILHLREENHVRVKREQRELHRMYQEDK